MSTNVLVFVYGTLKSGYKNNYILEGANYVAKAITSDAYVLLNLGAFPAIVDPSNVDYPPCRVSGELYEVDPLTLERLDYLEREGELYERRKIHVASPEGLKIAYAYIFIPIIDFKSKGFEPCEIINSNYTW